MAERKDGRLGKVKRLRRIDDVVMDALETPARSPRSSVMLRAFVQYSDRPANTQHRVLNISRTGVCIAKVEGMAADDVVAVTIGQTGYVPAKVAWVRDGNAGLTFQTPIDPAIARMRAPDAGMPQPTSGWMGEMKEFYRR